MKKTLIKGTLVLTMLAIFPFMSKADEIDVGKEAPKVTVTLQNGETLDLEKVYKEGPVLVYFYPKADTPGCTAQACNLRDNFDTLRTAGIKVIGVSRDSVDSQARFKQKYELPFDLVADTEGKLAQAFGVGKAFGMFYDRQAYLIKDGVVVWRDLDAKPKTQSEDALQALKNLSSPKMGVSEDQHKHMH